MTRLPLRWMLLIPLLVSIAIGFLAFAIAVDVSERSRRLAEVDLELVRAGFTPVRSPTDDLGEGPPAIATAEDSSLPVQLVIAADGEIVARQGGANPFSPSTLSILATTTTTGAQTIDGYRTTVSRVDASTVRVTALSLDPLDAAIASLRQTLIVGGVVIVLVEGTVVWILANLLARPLASVTAGVSQIADGDLDTVVKPTEGSREIARLSADIGRMVDRLRDALSEREQLAVDATRARQDMQRLLADVSHEIRTPLAALKGYSDLYAHGMLTAPDALGRAMVRVGDESMRLHHLVSAMMELARTGATPEHAQVRVELASATRDVVDDLRAAFPGREIDVAPEPVPGVSVIGDPSRLHQALLNLGANACAHTPHGSSISFETSVVADEATVSVVDHGPGIAEADRANIFLPFFRADPARARGTSSGAGLGLSVSDQIAREHGGSLTVRTTPGGGATFVLRLPRWTG